MAEEAVADTLLLAIDPGSYISLEFEEMDVSKVTDKLTNPILKYIKLHKSDIEEFFSSAQGLELDDFVEQDRKLFTFGRVHYSPSATCLSCGTSKKSFCQNLWLCSGLYSIFPLCLQYCHDHRAIPSNWYPAAIL